MTKKNLIILLIAIMAIAAIVLVSYMQKQPKEGITEQQLLQKFQLLKTQYEQAKAQGYDISDVEKIGRQAKQAFDNGDYKKASELLDKASVALEKITTPAIPSAPEVKVETICTDGIDNDGDGSIDNEGGDCWIREGAVFAEDYRPLRTFKNLTALAPQLKDIGVKTIEMFGLWAHGNAQYPGYRWATSDFSKLDPARGDETEFKAFLDDAHSKGLKIIPLVAATISFAPSSVCEAKTCQKAQYDLDKNGGGALYKYWEENKSRDIFLKNKNGDFSCDFAGYGYIPDLESKDVVNFFKKFYNEQISDRKLDGIRIDTPIVHSCEEGEKVYQDCNLSCVCPDPSTKQQDTMAFFRILSELKQPNQVFISESYYSHARSSNWFCSYPYYPPDTDLDEVAAVSEGYEFEYILGTRILRNLLASSQYVDWINNQPIKYNRQRFRMIRNMNGVDELSIKFVSLDKRYYPAVTLAVTTPGVPKVTDYELFGNKDYDDNYKIIATNIPESRASHWKKVLNIRNFNNALKYGDIKNVWKSGDNIYAYSRTYGNETVIVIINFNSKQAESVLDIPFDKGTQMTDELSGETFNVGDPINFNINVPAYDSRILTIKR